MQPALKAQIEEYVVQGINGKGNVGEVAKAICEAIKGTTSLVEKDDLTRAVDGVFKGFFQEVSSNSNHDNATKTALKSQLENLEKGLQKAIVKEVIGYENEKVHWRNALLGVPFLELDGMAVAKKELNYSKAPVTYTIDQIKEEGSEAAKVQGNAQTRFITVKPTIPALKEHLTVDIGNSFQDTNGSKEMKNPFVWMLHATPVYPFLVTAMPL